MCAQFIIKANIEQWARREGLNLARAEGGATVDTKVLPHQAAPIVVQRDGATEPELVSMGFSLVPKWSKVRRPKFATHNARIETIAEKPTWKGPFFSRHCLVPMTHFIEPIYEGQWAGNMVRFHRKDMGPIAAAGLWDEWVDRESGEAYESFTIITDKPNKFVDEMGHDRMPVFLDPSAWADWLSCEKNTAKHWMAILSQRENPNLDISADRPMRPGWEKRK